MKRKSEYDIQAEQFAEKHNITMKAVYIGHRARFDNHITAVYSVTLFRPNKEPYNFEFSTSIQDSWAYQERGVFKKRKGLPPRFDLVKLFKQLEGAVSCNVGGYYYIRQTKKAPALYDVLACLCSDEPMFFEEWCMDYGYDSDSRKAFEIYTATQKEASAVNRLFADCLDELSEIT